MALLEDAAELAVTAEADAVFAYLETNTPWLKSAVLKNNAARFSTLRICNSLLRRLSKTSAASLCGCALSCAHLLASPTAHVSSHHLRPGQRASGTQLGCMRLSFLVDLDRRSRQAVFQHPFWPQ